MMRAFVSLPVFLTFSLLTVRTTSAEPPRHMVDLQHLRQAALEHASSQESDRAAVRDALCRPEVQEVAGRLGVNLDRAMARIETMDGIDLQRAAAAAREADRTLVGGASTVTLSTTTIIIALLVIILIVVAVK
jgi:hypothetical protein